VQRRRSKRLVVSLAAVAVVALAAGPGTASAADKTATGTPGWVDAQTVGLAGPTPTDIFTAVFTTGGVGYEHLWLYPTPASAGRQVATVTSKVWACGANVTEENLAYFCSPEGARTASWYVNSGGPQYVSDRSPLDITFYTSASRVYYGQLTVTWYTTGGVELGQKVVNYRGQGDGQCANDHCGYSGYDETSWGYQFT
jgi:hypothetical protein